ncbi:MAG: hypothetical protein DRQ78_11865 [Epsilonproteobacteria bacterium]|nr:MAG: hypothetical protein DRQ78_11865 [Campylobacterota bacterium]
MSAKITLYSEEALIEKVKIYAKEHNTSVSKIVNNFFKNLLQKNKINNANNTRSKITDSLMGRLKNTNVGENTYDDYLKEKYL